MSRQGFEAVHGGKGTGFRRTKTPGRNHQARLAFGQEERLGWVRAHRTNSDASTLEMDL